ncbi:MAG: glycosyl transferase, group 1, partial [Mycobacterium sp.]|nr:glycosyl transferase, group 1 [Mycobacterium sp.]
LADADPDVVSSVESVPELAVPAARLSTALTAAGHDVTVYLPSPGGAGETKVVSAQGYRVVRLPGGSGGGAVQKDLGQFTDGLHNAWRRDRPDVVHTQSWLSGMAGQTAARPHGIPIVQSFDAVGSDCRSGDVHKLVSVLARRANWVAANNTEELFELLKTGCARSRISVVPCGVDSEVFTPPGPAAPRGRFPHRLISVWTTTGQFDLDTATHALAALPDTELVLAVDPVTADAAAVKDQLSHAADLAGVGDRVSLAEVRNHTALAELLRSADVCVCAASTDPTGAGALMAMSCGVPVVAKSVGALADIIVDEVTGRLVPPSDVPRFVEAARRLLHEPFAGRGMGAAGRDRARSRYSWDRVAADATRAFSGAARTVGQVPA